MRTPPIIRETRRLRFLHNTLAVFVQEKRAVALVEFAVAMPVLIIFMLGASEMARYVNATRQITNLANSLATLLAVRQTALTHDDASFAFNSTVVTFPVVLKDARSKGKAWQNDIDVTLSSIQMTKTLPACVVNCAYKAKVVWSIKLGSAGTRSCSTAPVSVADTNAPSLTTLPRDVFNPDSIVVADVAYTYTPVFGTQFVPTVTIRRSAYLQPRYLATLRYASSGSADTYQECP